MLKGNFLVWSDKLYKTIFFGFFWVFLMQANFFWPGLSTWSGLVVTQQRDNFYLKDN